MRNWQRRSLIFLGFIFFGVFILNFALKTPVIFMSGRTHQIEIKPGDTLTHVIAKLKDMPAKIVLPDVLIRLYFILTGAEHQLKVGFYALPKMVSLSDLRHVLINSSPIKDCFTIVEGKTSNAILNELSQYPYIQDVKNLKKRWALAMHAEGKPYEGQLLAETFCFLRGEQALNILKRSHRALLSALDKRTSQLGQNALSLSAAQILTLSSLIEKESANEQERALVSSVIWNRLKSRMRLQIDSSVIYGLGGGTLSDDVKRKLAKKTPYNTYQIKGLPPTPIANVGLSALDAAFFPEKTNYYYFVREPGSKKHYFSVTYREHLQKIKEIKEKV